MESPFFDRSRYRTDYHCHVLVYSALSSADVNSVLKQIARRNNDDMLRSRSQSRDYSAIGSPSKHQSEGSQLPNPLQIVVPLTEPVKKVESDRARVNFKFLLKSRQTTRQELVIDAAVESGAIVDFVILLFDLTDRSSFQALDKLISDFKSEYSAHNLAEPTSIIAVGKVQNQEIHQLIYRDEIDLWCSRHPPTASLAVRYLEYTVMYSQGVSDLLAMLIEPFQSRYVTQLSREKSMESPSGRNSIGAGFFQSSYGQHAVDDSAISASGAHNMTASAGMDSMGFDSSRESSGKRKMSAPPALTLSTGNDSDFHMSKSELLERREEQKRAERQRKWQDMESQMRLMLESDQQEEELAERQEQERLQRAASNASSASLPHNNSGGTSNIQLNPSASSSSIMSSAFGLLRNLPPLPPSPSNGAQQQQQQPSSAHNYSMNTASNAHPPSLSLQPPSNFNASMAAAFGMTQYSSAGSLTPPVPIANTTSSSPSATTSNKRMSKFLFPHNPANNKHHHSAAASGDMMSLKSRSDDAYDHHHHQYRGYGMATQPQRPSIAGHAAAAASSMSAYHYPTTVLPHGSSSTSHHYHHGMHAPPMGGGGAAASAAANAPPPPGGGYGSHQTRSRPLSTSSLHLPPLPGLLNYPTASSMAAANSNANNFVHPPSSSSAVVTASTSNTNTNSNTPTNPTPIIASSSSSSISQVVQSVLKRTGSMRSQASQRTSSQVSLRSRHSSHYTVNSSRASSGLDLHVPSADEINLLIETMHSAVKAEQDLFHQTMYLYGASGSDLLLLSSEDGDDDGNGEDDDNDNEDEEEDGGLDGDGLLSMGDDASSTVRPLSSATTSVSGTAGGPSTRPKKTQPQTAAGDSTAPTKAVRTPRGGSQPPVPSHVQAGSPSRRQGRTAAQQQQQQQPAQAQPPHPSYATSPSSRRHGSLSRAHPSATMAAGNSAYNRSYISDLSMSSRYTQNSLEERGLIDPERGYPAPPAPSDLPVSSPRQHHHHHLHAHLYHPPHAVGPGAGGLPPPLGGYATEESVVVASLPAIDGRQRGGSAPTKEEEDHLLDIIVGLIPSPSTNVHKSYRGSPTARSRSNRLSLTQSTSAAGGGGGGSETASVVSVSRQRPSLRSEVDATHDTDADVDSLASPTTIASDHGGGAPSPRPPSGTRLPPGVEEIPPHPSKRPTHRYLIGCGCM